jgi:exosortase A
MNMSTAALPSWNWRRLAPGLLLLLLTALLFRSTAQAIVHIWNTSDTYAHAFLVPPISLWLVWRQRAALATIPLRTAPWLLLPMAVLSLTWLVGELAAAQALTQFCLVALLVLSVPTVFGWRLARALAFPLLFLFFAVPVGDFLVPQMMDWTADFTVMALQFTGIPVYREGLQFVVPTGNWSVVAACSGVRYLIASFMVGTLFAYLNYRTLRKRLIFVAVSLLVPILANWLRAYMIVMIGHLSGNKYAVGADHLVYGWVFFGIVIALMFWIGSHFSDPADPVETASRTVVDDPAAIESPATQNPLSAWWVGAAAVALMVTVQAGYGQILQKESGSAEPSFVLSNNYGNWVVGPAPDTNWTPAFQHARAVATGSYSDGVHTAAVWVGYYRNQGYNRKLISSSNVLAKREEAALWFSSDKGTRLLSLPGLATTVNVAELRASLSLPGAAVGAKNQQLRVWHLYWLGGAFVADPVQARLRLSLNRVLGKGDDAAVLVFYAPTDAAAGSTQADANLAGWVGAALPALGEQLLATQSKR